MDNRSYKRLVNRAVGKVQKKLNKLRVKCLYPDCTLDAINSHSQHKEGQLRTITENGEVFRMQDNQYQMAKNGWDNRSLIRTGIAKASTFKGYCSKHDRALFEPVELRPLKQNDEEQAFVLFVRACSYELAKKRRALKSVSFMINEIRSFADNDHIAYLESVKEGKEEYFRHDAPYMSKIFSALENREFSSLSTNWKTVPDNIGLSACCIFSPWLDKYEEFMEGSEGALQPMVAFNLGPGKRLTHMITSWPSNFDDFCDWIIPEISMKKGLELYINRCAFAESEDTCVRPSLWESLSRKDRRNAEVAMAPNHVRGPLDSVPRIARL